jgi:hypothetical protein
MKTHQRLAAGKLIEGPIDIAFGHILNDMKKMISISQHSEVSL